MQAIDNSYIDTSKILNRVGDGILVLHQKYSGNFLMLKNYITSFIQDYNNVKRLNGIKFYSIDDSHPLFDELVETYQIKHSNALMVIRGREVANVLNGPLRKYELQHQLDLLFHREFYSQCGI